MGLAANGGVTYTSAQLCQLAEITYRQLMYWAGLGYLTPVVPLPGSGRPHIWPAAAVARARALKAASALRRLPVDELADYIERSLARP